MRNRKPAVKIALRIIARRNPQFRSEIRQVMGDADLLDGVVEECVAIGGLCGVGDDGPFITFIKMLLDNQEGILAFIKAILLIFASKEGK